MRALLTGAVAFAVLGASAAPGPAVAWGDEGHMIVAAIAYKHLTPAARAKVDALLAADTDTLTARDFASRATWADAWKYSDNHGPRYQHTSQWHFVDIELSNPDVAAACFGHVTLGPGVAASDGPNQVCALDKIDQFSAELARPDTPQAEQILALKCLEHLVGDIHQPLHAADNHDAGGNCQSVKVAPAKKATKFHSWWDTNVVKAIGTNAALVADTLDTQISAADLTMWQSGTPTDWAMEAHQVAIDTAYTPELTAACSGGHAVGTVKLGSTYRKAAVAAARLQLERGGARLAYILNTALQ